MYSMLKTILMSNFGNTVSKLMLKSSFNVSRSFAKSGEEIKFNFNEECENQINQQINQELNASYAYFKLAYHFEHPAIALSGFFTMFLYFSKEETEHAQKLIEFQNKRGGNVKYINIEALQGTEWTPESAVEKAIELEKCVTKNLHILHEKGAKFNDSHLCDFVESVYLQEQYAAIKDLYDLLTKIKRVDKGTGIYILDKDLNNKFKNKKI